MESAGLYSRSRSSSSIVLMAGVRALPSAAPSAKAETRAGETHTGVDTVRGREGLFLAERERPLLLLLVVCILLILLLLLQWW